VKYGVYVHIPFCRSKCPYCDFVSFPEILGEVIDGYVRSLAHEISYWSAFVDSHAHTFYIGGGTPSLLPADALARIVELLYEGFGEPVEFTIEANPEDLADDNLAVWERFGINRISVGVQTTNDGLLEKWGRRKISADRLKSIRRSFVLNMDFIYPTYLPTGWRYDVTEDVELVKDVRPQHLSWYILDLHPGTRLAGWVRSGQWHEVDEDILLSDMQIIYDELRAMGYLHYEISNWALPGFYSRHNLGYWQGRPYIGLGVSSSGFWAGFRWTNTISLRDYILGRWFDKFYRPVGNEILVEIGSFALRTLQDGLNRELWERYGGNFDEIASHAADVHGVIVSGDKILLEDSVDVLMISNVIIGEVLSPWL